MWGGEVSLYFPGGSFTVDTGLLTDVLYAGLRGSNRSQKVENNQFSVRLTDGTPLLGADGEPARVSKEALRYAAQAKINVLSSHALLVLPHIVAHELVRV